DVPRRTGTMARDASVSSDGGKPVTGRIPTQFTPDAGTETCDLDTSGYFAISRNPPVNPGSPENQLTVREGFLGTARVIPRDQWRLDGKAVSFNGGFQPGQTYELSYEAKDPAVAGLGFAAIRDLAAYVKHPPAGAP